MCPRTAIGEQAKAEMKLVLADTAAIRNQMNERR